MSKEKTILSLKDSCTDGEKLLVQFFIGQTGSFYTLFFEAAMAADGANLSRLAAGFPGEIEAVKNYKFVPGYWEDVQRRYGR